MVSISLFPDPLPLRLNLSKVNAFDWKDRVDSEDRIVWLFYLIRSQVQNKDVDINNYLRCTNWYASIFGQLLLLSIREIILKVQNI